MKVNKIFTLSALAIIMIGSLASCSSVSPIKQEQKILFVCGGNTGRSPMAEYLANDYFHFPGSGYIADSRGANVNPQEVMPEANAVIVMQELGVNMRGHRAAPVTQADIDSAKLVLVMTEGHKQKLQQLDPSAKNIYLLSECATGKMIDVPDAYGHDLKFYERTRDTIKNYIRIIQKNDMKCITY